MTFATSNPIEYAEHFLERVQHSPSSYHAAAIAADQLRAAGFEELQANKAWKAEPGGYYLLQGGALIAWVVPPNARPHTPFRILGSHTDSPGLKLKVHPDITAAGWHQAAVEIYGGPILASWLDRDLRLGGRIVLENGETRLVETGPILRVPHLAIHLDRQANESLKLDKQGHMQPVFSATPECHEENGIMGAIAQSAGVDPHRILAHDLITTDAQPGQRIGADGELIAAGRLDNLASFFPSIDALIQVRGEDSDAIMVVAGFDHEEVGSQTSTGAAGPLLGNVLERTLFALGADVEDRMQAYAASSCVSADVAHAIHPNYQDRHDAVNYPSMGKGVVLKVNAQQRYASDALSEAAWFDACRKAGVESQVFVGNNSMPCGSTIGPISATRLGIQTVDVGIPVLSMHSARELAHVKDLWEFAQVAKAYLADLVG
ncbi:M18 family aminopeptidase [Corynebacterium gerontici]|uniref:M18 family aminopeptidase n=1 Tax=Corynebacterium gerontici TaxID=2079234 RepID=A0A3G6J0V4_9CORY|nr:M18 family aminopeptidase [Corynebacterium gerontici]AZA11423.1 putative M18 family aminopeptidase 2 [Corynebacterium gerontici]